jgi:hypothetical protein
MHDDRSNGHCLLSEDRDDLVIVTIIAIFTYVVIIVIIGIIIIIRTSHDIQPDLASSGFQNPLDIPLTMFRQFIPGGAPGMVAVVLNHHIVPRLASSSASSTPRASKAPQFFPTPPHYRRLQWWVPPPPPPLRQPIATASSRSTPSRFDLAKKQQQVKLLLTQVQQNRSLPTMTQPNPLARFLRPYAQRFQQYWWPPLLPKQ